MIKLRFFEIGWRTRTDGPGSRVIIYLQGCHLRCLWCHSPHSWNRERAPLLFNATLCTNCGKCEAVCPNGVHRIIENRHIIDRDACDGKRTYPSVWNLHLHFRRKDEKRQYIQKFNVYTIKKSKSQKCRQP